MTLGRSVPKNIPEIERPAFSPSKLVTHAKKGVGAAYEYKEDPPAKRRNTRDEEGAVIIAPKGFLTNPMKLGKIGTHKTVAGKIEYMADDYNIKKKIE